MPDLLVTIDRDSDVGLRAQLEGQLRDAIRTRRLAAGERLPISQNAGQTPGPFGSLARISK